jgi:hypothetical protein
MKRIHEMNDAEILTLTDDQITKLIDYECALEGVPFLPPNPGPKPEKPAMEKGKTCYSIGGVYVLDMKHAVKILEAITSDTVFKTDYTGSDYNNQYLKRLSTDDYGYPSITTHEYPLPEQWDKVKDAMAAYKHTLKAWEELNTAYTSAVTGRQDIVDAAYETVSAARNRRYEMDSLRSEFERYMELAEQNPTVAMNFLVKSRNIVCNYPELVEELCPGYKL